MIVIAEVAIWFRGDWCGTRFPQECRRSGLNEGTIRKWRLGEADDVDEGDSLSISVSNDMMIDWFSFVSFFLYYIDVIEARNVWKKSNTYSLTHISTHTGIFTRTVAFLYVCREYRVESWSKSIVESMLREQEKNKDRVRFVVRRENRLSKRYRKKNNWLTALVEQTDVINLYGRGAVRDSFACSRLMSIVYRWQHYVKRKASERRLNGTFITPVDRCGAFRWRLS